MIVTIDGPSGSGKSSTARALARRLGFDFLDTGAMYRAVALAARRASVDPNDPRQLDVLLSGLHLEMPPGRVLLNGEDVTDAIRTPEASSGASKVAVLPAVRRFLARQQRAIAAGRNIICEGRDQGTVVFPDAGRKFFFTADPMERAARRYRELVARGESVTLESVYAAQLERDRRDAERDLAPLRPAEDAVVIDSTRMNFDDVLALVEREVRRCWAG
jgi:cytidylate kinase